MNDNDEYGFWDDARGMSMTGPITRPNRVVRHHSANRLPQFWPRLGVLLAVGLVAMTVALAISNNDTRSRVVAVTAKGAPQTPVGFDVGAVGNTVVAGPIDASVTPTAAPETEPPVAAEPNAEPAATPPAVPKPVAATPLIVTKIVCTRSYTVVAGDYWIGIASRAKVTLGELLAANNATSKTAIYPGGSVCLPNNAVVPAPVPTTVAPKPTTAPAPPVTTAKATPTATAPAPTTAPAPPARYYSAAEVEQIIRDVWPDDLEDKAILIAKRESSLNPSAHNYCCFGLFQIHWLAHRSWLAAIGVTSSNMLFDPQVNARAALALYMRAGGWGPWSM